MVSDEKTSSLDFKSSVECGRFSVDLVLASIETGLMGEVSRRKGPSAGLLCRVDLGYDIFDLPRPDRSILFLSFELLQRICVRQI